jgi:uncharacterized protein YbjT (DUF2867 family)
MIQLLKTKKMKQTILVTGATGAQGGSIVKALLAEKKYSVRAMTRNPNSEKALQLKTLGVEVIQADMDDPKSLEKAMEGCYGVYGVTNFWEHFGKEWQQGKNLIDAVKKSNIQHFVFHTLPSYCTLSKGQYPTPHCDIKAQLQEYTQQQNIPATFVHIAFYYENFFTYFPPQLQADRSFAFGFPQGNTKLGMVSVEDVGKVVTAIFNTPEDNIGKTVGIVGANDTCENYAAIMSKVLDLPVKYNYIPHAIFSKFDFPGAEELANMFEVQRLYIPSRHHELKNTQVLNPQTISFENWVSKNKGRFKTLLGG